MSRFALFLLLSVLVMPVAADEHRDFDDRTYFAPSVLFASPARGSGFDEGWGLNLAIGKPVSQRVSWEMSLSGYDQSAVGPGSLHRRGVHLAWMYHFADQGNIRPFISLGGGVLRSRLLGVGDSGFVAHPGVGVIIPVTDSVSFRLEGRYQKAFESGQHNDWQFFAGLSIPFFARPEPAAPPPAPVMRAAPAPQPAPPPPPPAPRDPELHPVYFALDSSALDARSQQTLDAAVATMRDHDDLVIEVGGYTCTIGTEEYNLQLSQQRAQAVVEYLAGRGVARNRMMLRAYGEADPIADNSTDAGRRMNRRVELVILDR